MEVVTVRPRIMPVMPSVSLLSLPVEVRLLIWSRLPTSCSRAAMSRTRSLFHNEDAESLYSTIELYSREAALALNGGILKHTWRAEKIQSLAFHLDINCRSEILWLPICGSLTNLRQLTIKLPMWRKAWHDVPYYQGQVERAKAVNNLFNNDHLQLCRLQGLAKSLTCCKLSCTMLSRSACSYYRFV